MREEETAGEQWWERGNWRWEPGAITDPVSCASTQAAWCSGGQTRTDLPSHHHQNGFLLISVGGSTVTSVHKQNTVIALYLFEMPTRGFSWPTFGIRCSVLVSCSVRKGWLKCDKLGFNMSCLAWRSNMQHNNPEFSGVISPSWHQMPRNVIKVWSLESPAFSNSNQALWRLSNGTVTNINSEIMSKLIFFF